MEKERSRWLFFCSVGSCALDKFSCFTIKKQRGKERLRTNMANPFSNCSLWSVKGQ
jgi:hypothetical protein